MVPLFFNLHIGGVESKLGLLGTSATYWPIVPALGDCEDGEFGGMNGRGNSNTRRKPALTPLCPPQIPLDQTRDWTRAATVGSQQLTASAMVRPYGTLNYDSADNTLFGWIILKKFLKLGKKRNKNILLLLLQTKLLLILCTVCLI
jgi:hypothetical protein